MTPSVFQRNKKLLCAKQNWILTLLFHPPTPSRLLVGLDFKMMVETVSGLPPSYSFRSAFCCTCGFPELAFLTDRSGFFSDACRISRFFLCKVSEVKSSESSVMALSFSAILCVFWLLYVTMLPQFKFVLLWEDV